MKHDIWYGSGCGMRIGMLMRIWDLYMDGDDVGGVDQSVSVVCIVNVDDNVAVYN